MRRLRQRRQILPGSRVVLEGERLRAVLEEGRSQNGNRWTRTSLEQVREQYVSSASSP